MTSLSRPRVEFISTILQTVLNLGLLCLGLILVVFLGKETVHLADVLFWLWGLSKISALTVTAFELNHEVCQRFNAFQRHGVYVLTKIY